MYIWKWNDVYFGLKYEISPNNMREKSFVQI